MKFLFSIWVLKIMADDRSKKPTSSPNKRKRYSAQSTDCNENILKKKKEVCAEKRSDAKNKRNWYATLSREKKQQLLSKKREAYAKKRKLMIDCENSSSNFSNRHQKYCHQ